jgi:hypothetical protein
MPVETRETQPLACFDKPAHPDKGGTVPITPSQTINPGQIDTFDIPVSRVTISPRPEPEELADDGILLKPAKRCQSDYRWIVCKVMSHFQPRTHLKSSHGTATSRSIHVRIPPRGVEASPRRP